MILADYDNKTTLYLAWPEGVYEYNYPYAPLAPFYAGFLNYVPDEIGVRVFFKSPDIMQDAFERIAASSPGRDFEPLINVGLETIWLRDCAGFDCGEYIAKPIYGPGYGSHARDKRISDNMRIMHTLTGKDMVEIPLIWDGGNLVTNGTVGFISERILKENAPRPLRDVEAIIRDNLGIEPVFIPDPNDQCGHADGYLSFINENTIAVSRYVDKLDPKLTKYADGLVELCQSLGFNIVRLLDDFNEFEEDIKGIESAVGLAANFLLLNDTALVPCYAGKDEARGSNEAALSPYVKAVNIKCDDIAKYGGALHCFSWAV